MVESGVVRTFKLAGASADRHVSREMYACLFDIDGTLIHTGGAGKAAMCAALEMEFAALEPRDGVPFVGRTDRAIIHELLAVSGIDPSLDNRRRFLSGYLRCLPSCLVERSGRVLPGVASLLAQLSSRNDVAVGLLTGNIRQGAEAKLAHYDLDRHFAFGAFGDEHMDRDDVAHTALAETRAYLGQAIAPERVWVIGDSLLDVRCARSIGARVLAVATGWHSRDQLAAEGPDLLLDDLSDPAPLLANLARE